MNAALPTTTQAWPPPADALPSRSLGRAIGRGLAGRCPHCGKGRLFRAFLKVADACDVCGEELHHHRADDAPPYLTMFAVGHLIVPLMLAVEGAYHPPVAIHLAIWLPTTLGLALALLAPIKGAVVGLQWALRMHGFHPGGDPADPVAEQWGTIGGERG